MAALIFFIILSLFLSAFFSGSEIAFISANKLGVEVEKDKGTRRGNILARFYQNPKDFLSSMLVGNNIALVVFTTLMGILLQPYLEDNLGQGVLLLLVMTIIVTIIVLIFGEFLPKVLFRHYSNEILYMFAYPLVFFKQLLRFPSWIMIKLSNFLLKYVFGTSSDNSNDVITRLDLQDFVEGSLSPAQDEIDAELFRNALYLKRIKVKDCMVPRTEIEDLDVSESIDSLIEIFRSTGHSRIIITEGNVDNVLGYIHHLQVYSYPKSLRKNVMEIQFVPETMNVNKLMLQFIYDGNTIACVVDEYGGTAGIITLEDILEEIFGEIEDEHDEEEYVDKQLSDTEWLFSGRLEIDYLNEQYENLNLPEGDYTTISGYIVMTSGSIPEQGETLELDGFQFIFEHVSETKIETVHVTKLNESSE